MRTNQLSMLVVRLDGKEIEGIPQIISIYADAWNVWKAIGMAISAATMCSLGQKEVPEPSFCACEVVTDLDEKEFNRHYVRSVWKHLKESLLSIEPPLQGADELLNDHEGEGRVFVHLYLERFNRAVPKDYPKEEQVILVDWLGEDVFTAMANAFSLLVERIREYEPVPFDDGLRIKTNTDEVRPLKGSMERFCEAGAERDEHCDS